jgi:anti-sigma28 factor (negative regulator of flagellin synthesis)
MELNGLGPKSLKDTTVKTAQQSEPVAAKHQAIKPELPTNPINESVSISQTAKNLIAQEQRIGQSEPQNPKIAQLKKLVETGEYQQTIDDAELAKNLLGLETQIFSKP